MRVMGDVPSKHLASLQQTVPTRTYVYILVYICAQKLGTTAEHCGTTIKFTNAGIVMVAYEVELRAVTARKAVCTCTRWYLYAQLLYTSPRC